MLVVSWIAAFVTVTSAVVEYIDDEKTAVLDEFVDGVVAEAAADLVVSDCVVTMNTSVVVDGESIDAEDDGGVEELMSTVLASDNKASCWDSALLVKL